MAEAKAPKVKRQRRSTKGGMFKQPEPGPVDTPCPVDTGVVHGPVEPPPVEKPRPELPSLSKIDIGELYRALFSCQFRVSSIQRLMNGDWYMELVGIQAGSKHIDETGPDFQTVLDKVSKRVTDFYIK